MYLSNPRSFGGFLFIVVSLFTACGSSGEGGVPAGKLPEPKTRFPFTQKEPLVYQAEVFVGDGTGEERFFVARNNDKMRVEMPNGRVEVHGRESFTMLPSAKVWAESRTANSGGSDASLDAISKQYFAGADYRDYQRAGTDGGLTVYQAKPNDISKDKIKVWIDEATGLMMKQQFSSENGENVSVVELRNVKLEATDDLFTVPAGYKKITQEELDRLTNKQ